MNTVLVSGASGIIGYGILKSLKKSGKSLKLVGTTIYEDSVAQGFSDIFEKALVTDDIKYLDWLLGVIRKHKIELLIPGIEADMYKWAEFIQILENEGVVVMVNNLELIKICKDKWIFYQSLSNFKSPYLIETSLSKEFEKLSNEFGLPFLLKPRQGHGSKGIVVVNDEELFEKYMDISGDAFMAQKIVGEDNEEYTTSAFCDGFGGYYCSMTLKRKLSKDGFTEKAEVANPSDIDEALKSLCNIYKPKGPTNFQFRRHNGILKLLEINPRISSSTSIRAAFGYNESLMSIEYFLDNKQPTQPKITQGKAVRYVEDFIFYK